MLLLVTVSSDRNHDRRRAEVASVGKRKEGRKEDIAATEPLSLF